MRRIQTLVPAVSALLLLTACGSPASTPSSDSAGLNVTNVGQLTVCSHLANPPFEFVKDGQPAGFDMDLADALTAKLGLDKKEVVDIPFEALKSGAALNAGQCDVGINQVTPTPERRKNIGFSADYLNDPEATGTREGESVKTWTDLENKVLGVTIGSVEETAFRTKTPKGATITSYEDLLSLRQSVLTGQTDVIFYTYSGLAYEQDPGIEIGPDVLDIPNTYAVAVKKEGSKKLLAAVNDALDSLKSEGTIDELTKKWFGNLPSDLAPKTK